MQPNPRHSSATPRGYDRPGAARAGSSRTRRAVVGLAAVAVLVVAAVFVLTRGTAARSNLDDFLAAWEDERYAAAAALTDGEPRGVVPALEENRDGLDGAALETEVLEFEEEGEDARASVRLSWQVPVIGTFEYTTQVPLRRGGDEWAVQWSSAIVHPALEAGQRLGTVREFDDRRPILDPQAASW